MTAFYALPDHEVIRELIPGIEQRRVSVDVALAQLRACPALIPVAIEPTDGGLVYLADIGSHPLREWQFMYSIKKLAEDGALGQSFVTDMALLGHRDLAPAGLSPSGFIFHVSRCGSTLLAKALARSPRNVGINQGGPLQRGFWAALSDDWRQPIEASECNLEMFRNLVLLLARRRSATQTRSFFKFISWNILYQDFVHAAFPQVPQLFLYREPVEVIASVRRETTAILQARGSGLATFLTGFNPERESTLSDIAYLAHCYARYLTTALEACQRGTFTPVNYRSLVAPDALPEILETGLGLAADDEELSVMREQFRFYSKDDADQSHFKPDAEAKTAELAPDERRVVEEICSPWLERLDKAAQAATNLV